MPKDKNCTPATKQKVPKDLQPDKPFIIKDGEVFAKVTTKQGSKEYQKNIDRASPIVIEQIVKEIEPRFADLLIDHYGNYFC